jgi:hypothetical protein
MAMAMKPRDIPAILIERIEAAHPAPGSFAADETHDWPSEVLPALLRQGVIAEADRAEAVTCPGCEWQCTKRVVVRKAGATSSAFIICDEEQDHGRIPVPLNSLRTFVTGLGALSRFAAAVLRIGPPKVSRHSAAYVLGAVNGRNGMRPVIVAIEDGKAMLVVGEEREHMARVLQWIEVDLVLDGKLVQRLADRKTATSTTERRQKPPDRSVQSARKKATNQRDLAIFREAKKRQAAGGVSLTRVAEVIAKTELACGLSAGSIRRIVTKHRGDERKKSRSNPRSRK